MILLDTNVVSEPMRPVPDQRVMDWLDTQVLESLYISSINLAEIREGVELLPAGKRRTQIERVVNRMLETLIGDRVLAFDRDAALYFAKHIVLAAKKGNVVGRADGQIASIAAVNSFVVATRDVEPFRAMGVKTINPWLGPLRL